MKRYNAFTLIELLVVIAIIVLLASILFPVFGRVRENARKSSCSSNLKQMGMGIMMYAQDFDEAMPLSINNQSFTKTATTIATWRTLIQPYIKSRQLFACPSNPAKRMFEAVPYGSGNNWINTPNPVSYSASAIEIDDMGAFAFTYASIKLSTFVEPSNCIAVLESTFPTNRFAVDNGTGSGQAQYMVDPPVQSGVPGASPTLQGAFFSGHLGSSNYLFMDGHVKALPPLATLSLAEGGTGRTNLWRRNATTFTDASSKNDAFQNLIWAHNHWK